MTNEIEAKRKELEHDVCKASGDLDEICSARDFCEWELEGFNLGVEMARKECEEEIKELKSKIEAMEYQEKEDGWLQSNCKDD